MRESAGWTPRIGVKNATCRDGSAVPEPRTSQNRKKAIRTAADDDAMGTQKEVDWDAPAITDVKMVHKGPWGPEGTLIPISIKDFEKKSSIRRKVAAASGLPYEHVKLILVGIAQIGAGDRRTNIKYGNCGVAEGIGLTFSTAAAGNKPHQPRATGNRVDNKGNWTQED